jgi:hypothetical protein
VDIKIERIPIPSRRRYPYPAMAVGDSFTAPAPQARSVRATASDFGRRHGWRFTVQSQPDGSVRVWRVS